MLTFLKLCYWIIGSIVGSLLGIMIMIKKLLNWIWFNGYIGLIAAHTLGFMVLRAGTDVLSMVIEGFLAETIIQKQKTNLKAGGIRHKVNLS